MSGNLFTDVYAVRQHMFGGAGKDESVSRLQSEVADYIEKGVMPSKLRYLLFKMTNRCNSNCEYCPQAISRMSEKDKMDVPLDVIRQTIKEAGELSVDAIAVNGGEPLIRDDIYSIISEIIGNGIVPVLMTNGLLLPKMWDRLGEIGLKYVIISFDSLDRAIYEKQRGCSFDVAMEGIDAALKLKEKYDDIEIHVSAVLTRDNHEQFIELIKYMTERGIKIHISPFHNYLRIDDRLSKIEKEEISRTVNRILEMKEQGYLIASSKGFIQHLISFFSEGEIIPADYKCKVGYTNLFVDAFMNVRPCWSEQIGIVGNLSKSSLKDIWDSRVMGNCRKAMLNCQCEGCWYMCTGEVTMLLDNILD